MDEVAVTVIGAGVVGLAVTAKVSRRREGVALVERHEGFGRETSSRNSEVVHAGIYYPPGSLKATLCVEGRRLLYEYAAAHGVPHRKLGKLIAATRPEEVGRLEGIMRNALGNGVEGLSLLDAAGARSLEPDVPALAAIHSAETGIIDSHALMGALSREAEASGALASYASEVVSLEPEAGAWVVGLADGYLFRSRAVVNSAGLASEAVARLAGVDTEAAGYRLRLCKGSYFAYSGTSPVSRLVYPVPREDLAGLGVHATLDMAGRLRFGPDVEFVETIGYDVDPGRREAFWEGASRLVTGLRREALVPDTAGIRPKLAGEGVRDFVISHEADRGLPGLVNLVGIESPGLTACLAIARRVADMIDGYLD